MNRIERLVAQFARKLGAWGEDWNHADRANRLLFRLLVVLFAFCVVMTVVQWFI